MFINSKEIPRILESFVRKIEIHITIFFLYKNEGSTVAIRFMFLLFVDVFIECIYHAVLPRFH